MGKALCTPCIFTKGNKFCDFLFDCVDDENHFKLGASLKGKNLLFKGPNSSFSERPSFSKLVLLLKEKICSLREPILTSKRGLHCNGYQLLD